MTRRVNNRPKPKMNASFLRDMPRINLHWLRSPAVKVLSQVRYVEPEFIRKKRYSATTSLFGIVVEVRAGLFANGPVDRCGLAGCGVLHSSAR